MKYTVGYSDGLVGQALRAVNGGLVELTVRAVIGALRTQDEVREVLNEATTGALICAGARALDRGDGVIDDHELRSLLAQRLPFFNREAAALDVATHMLAELKDAVYSHRRFGVPGGYVALSDGQLRVALDDVEPVIGEVFGLQTYLAWSWPMKGFGQLSLRTARCGPLPRAWTARTCGGSCTPWPTTWPIRITRAPQGPRPRYAYERHTGAPLVQPAPP